MLGARQGALQGGREEETSPPCLAPSRFRSSASPLSSVLLREDLFCRKGDQGDWEVEEVSLRRKGFIGASWPLGVLLLWLSFSGTDQTASNRPSGPRGFDEGQPKAALTWSSPLPLPQHPVTPASTSRAPFPPPVCSEARPDVRSHVRLFLCVYCTSSVCTAVSAGRDTKKELSQVQ